MNLSVSSGSDNGMATALHQAITYSNAELLSVTQMKCLRTHLSWLIVA